LVQLVHRRGKGVGVEKRKSLIKNKMKKKDVGRKA